MLSPFSAVTLLVYAGVGDDFLKGLKEEIKLLIKKLEPLIRTSEIRTPH